MFQLRGQFERIARSLYGRPSLSRDRLTGLQARNAFADRLEQTVRKNGRDTLYGAAIGIERFAQVRSAVGYDVATELVRATGSFTEQVLSDDFVTLLAPDIVGVAFWRTSEQSVEPFLKKLRRDIETYVHMVVRQIEVDLTIGFAKATDSAGKDLCAIKSAEIALDQARAGNHNVWRFDQTLYGAPEQRLSLMEDLSEGLLRNEFQLCYQPKFNARKKKVESVEALVRWHNKDRGFVSPAEFVPIAEETGHIAELTKWVVARAIRDQHFLADEGHKRKIAVNLSPKLLIDEEFMEFLFEVLEFHPSALALEITETAVFEDTEQALKHLNKLSELGVHLSIDDYGTGASSLAYLQQLPVNELKIDRSYIKRLTSSHRDPLIVRSTIELAHALELEVVAEGVEDATTMALLTVMGCDAIQGYFISKAVDVKSLINFLDDSDAVAAKADAGPMLLNVSMMNG